jgi:hypothetical protein
MAKKLVFSLLICMLVMFPVGNVKADGNPPPTVLISSPNTGRQAHVPVQEQHLTLQDGQLLTIYEAEITPQILTSLVDSKQAWDSSRAVKVTIWMYHDDFNANGYTWVSVSRYDTMWQRYDSSVSLSNARMNAGCFGESWESPPGPCSPYPRSQQANIG